MRYLLLACFLLGCSANGTKKALDPKDMGPNDVAPVADLGYSSLIAQRPYHFKLPAGYDPSQPTPLVILLHGYGVSGIIQEGYFRLSSIIDDKKFLYAYPDGLIDSQMNRYWNADDACCDFGHTGVDDVAYINAIIDDVQAKYNVDPKRIFLIGHSNGAFLAHRLACDAPRVAAIVSLAGAVWQDAARCQPSSPVAVLQVHGDADQTISYNGGSTGASGGTYPSAHQTVATWADKDGCTPGLVDTGMTLDVDAALAGEETKVERYAGCRGGAVELWTMRGGGHMPNFQESWPSLIYGFLSAHPKP
jgi:polyhydroxybutyrate depolymerase